MSWLVCTFPRATAAAAATFPRGTRVRIEQTRSEGTLIWYQIEVPNSGREGWVSCAEIEGQCFNSE